MLIAGLSACAIFEIDPVTNPNAADAAIVGSNASQAQLQSLINGLESRSRGFVATTSRSFGTFGRETLSFRDSDPRFTTDWLGRAGQPDAGFFAVVNTYDAPFQTIAQGNFLMDAGANTDAISEQQLRGLQGYVKTVQGFQFLVPLLAQSEGGIRIDITDPQNPGPFVSFDEGLTFVLGLLDEGVTDLNAAGDSFFFSLPSGWGSFNTPARMIEVNRAIKARASIYAEDWQGALTALNASFMNMSGNLNDGPALTYQGGDGTTIQNEAVGNPFNPFFFPLDAFSTQIEVVHPGVLADIEEGDLRAANKFFPRSPTNFVNNQALPQYVATHQDGRWSTNNDNVPFIRNEELVLIYAEAQAQTGNLAEAVSAINTIRSAAGLGDFTNPGNLDGVIDQLLFERRYSLWFEPLPHRWVDLRRYDRLSELEADFIATDEEVFTRLARPTEEQAWDDFIGAGG